MAPPRCRSRSGIRSSTCRTRRTRRPSAGATCGTTRRLPTEPDPAARRRAELHPDRRGLAGRAALGVLGQRARGAELAHAGRAGPTAPTASASGATSATRAPPARSSSRSARATSRTRSSGTARGLGLRRHDAAGIPRIAEPRLRDDELAGRLRPRPRGRVPLLHGGERDPGHRRVEPRARREHHGALQEAAVHERRRSPTSAAARRSTCRAPSTRRTRTSSGCSSRSARSPGRRTRRATASSRSRRTEPATSSAPVSVGSGLPVPSVAGETWVNVGTGLLARRRRTARSSSLMWSNRRAPSYQFALFSTTVGTWGRLAAGQVVQNPNFSVGSRMASWTAAGTSSTATPRRATPG